MTQAGTNPTATSRAARSNAQGAPCVAALAVNAGRMNLVVVHDRRVLLAETTGPDGLAALLRKAIERGASHLVTLVTADRVVCKPVATPVGSADEVNEAMSLLAEAELPVRIPACRRAWGRVSIPAANGDGMVRSILAGWMPESHSAEAAASDPIDAALSAIATSDAANKKRPAALHRHWLPEPVALLGVLDASGGSIAWASDASPARLAVAATGRDGLVCRASRGKPGVTAAESAHQQADSAAASVAIAESLESAVGDRQSAVAIDAGTLERLRARVAFGPGVAGGGMNTAWLAEFGLPLGAALLAADRLAGNPNDPLLAMRPAPPTRRRTTLDRLTDAFASPRNAGLAIAASIALALIIPWASAAIERTAFERRAATLEAKLNEATGSRPTDLPENLRDDPVRFALATWRQNDNVDRQVALYRSVRQLRWPMTKLLADATAALPVGADLDSVQLTVGQLVTLTGYADDQEIVNEFVQTLNNTGVFTGGVLNRSQRREGSTASRPVEFQVTVQVSRPFAEARGLPNNYAETPLAVLLYGERAREYLADAAPTGGMRIGQTTARPRTTAPRPRTTEAGTGTGTGQPSANDTAQATERPDRRSMFERPGEQPAPAADALPPPITAEQVAALSDAELREEFGNRRRASTRRDIEEADRARLTEETDLLRNELQRRRG